MHAVSMTIYAGGVPSSISGKPVSWPTLITGTPAASMALALPPVDTISYPASASPCMMRWPPVSLPQTYIFMHSVAASLASIVACSVSCTCQLSAHWYK